MKRIAALGLTLLLANLAMAQCTKDTDCKGDRICEKGVCVAPGASPERTHMLPNALKQQSPAPRFEDFPTVRHTGPWVPPKGMRRGAGDEWRDENGKLVDPPSMNFAGKFHVSRNSCGTGCRYFTLTDLSTGRDLALLAPFATGESPPKTQEGYTYITELITRPNSHMIIAQYLVDTPTGDECRERMFVMQGEKLRPVSNTRIGCGDQ